jgi:hypothetical protein
LLHPIERARPRIPCAYSKDVVRGCSGQKLPALSNRIFEWRINK